MKVSELIRLLSKLAQDFDIEFYADEHGVHQIRALGVCGGVVTIYHDPEDMDGLDINDYSLSL